MGPSSLLLSRLNPPAESPCWQGGAPAQCVQHCTGARTRRACCLGLMPSSWTQDSGQGCGHCPSPRTCTGAWAMPPSQGRSCRGQAGTSEGLGPARSHGTPPPGAHGFPLLWDQQCLLLPLPSFLTTNCGPGTLRHTLRPPIPAGELSVARPPLHLALGPQLWSRPGSREQCSEPGKTRSGSWAAGLQPEPEAWSRVTRCLTHPRGVPLAAEGGRQLSLEAKSRGQPRGAERGKLGRSEGP